ncbi:hypothetical protein BH10PAT3_BH10PAT3_7400 [soil metagenome]
MNISKMLKSSIVLGLLVSVMSVAPVGATSTTSNDCAVKMVGSSNSIGQANSRWTLNEDGSVTGNLKVTGNDNCEQTVTLTAWEAPNADKGMPYDQQKLVGHVTKTFSVGTHTISIKLPNCFYQLDLVKGSKATGIDNSPVYETDVMLGSLHGGTKACETPVKPETPITPTVPKVLPSTGAGSNIVVIAFVSTVLGYIVQIFRQRRAA